MDGILNKELVISRDCRKALLVLSFTTAIALGAYVRIPLPFTPVPLTLQTFFVLLSAALLGRRLAALSQVIYFAAGLSGIGVFSACGSGISYLLGPTGGYLFGFIPALFIASALSRKAGQNFFLLLASFLLADFFILACGTLWLKILSGYSGSQAFLFGFWPFVPGDALKAAAAALVFMKMSPRLREMI